MSINSIQYAGHSAVFFKAPNYTIAVDPWLEGNPACPKELQNPEKLDLIVLSHGHSDHAGDVVRLASLCKSKVAATFELAMLLIKAGVSEQQVIPMNKGGSTEVDGYTISLTHAMHSSSFDIDGQTYYAGEACGVVINDGTNSYYHAGDTALFSDMKLIKEQYQPSLACLPIGDRFTMGPKEAAKAAKILGVKSILPIHYKTFGLLTGTLEELEANCKAESVEARVLGLGAGEEVQLS